MEWTALSDQSFQNVCAFGSKVQPLSRARTLFWGLVGTDHVSPMVPCRAVPCSGPTAQHHPHGCCSPDGVDGDVQGWGHTRMEMCKDVDLWGCEHVGVEMNADGNVIFGDWVSWVCDLVPKGRRRGRRAPSKLRVGAEPRKHGRGWDFSLLSPLPCTRRAACSPTTAAKIQ